jgi:hypothetical protein
LDFPVIIERLRGTLLQLESTVKNIPDEKLSIKKEDKWSVKEVIGHLYDLKNYGTEGSNDFIEHKQTLRAADMTNTKTNAADHNSKPVDEL